MKPTRIVALSALIATAAGVLGASAPTGDAVAQQAAPRIDPADFSQPRANSYFPLRTGTVSRYRGTDEGERFREVVTVTDRTKTIQGVETTVVRDVVRRADGSLAEKTYDWYAADNDGNVWYFGEDTATYDDRGDVESREGSWQAGRDGAVAGMIMPADPKPTDAFRQEFYRGHAEDQAWVVARHGSTTVPYGRVHDVVRSFEWSRLEPQVMSMKLYGPGLGIVREKDIAGGDEVFLLVSVTRR